MQTNYNEVVVLQQGSVNNSRPAGKEVTDTRKKGVTEKWEKMKKREVKVQFKREPLLFSMAPTKDLRPLHTESEIFACVFPYSSSFPIKMHATDAKTQKIEPDLIFFWRIKVSEAVCKRDWHNVRSSLFFNMRKFRTQCTETFRPFYVMVIQIGYRVVHVSECVVGVWDGLDECEISRPEILSQSAPAYNDSKRALILFSTQISWDTIYFIFHRKKVIQVWSSIESKWWEKFPILGELSPLRLLQTQCCHIIRQ